MPQVIYTGLLDSETLEGRSHYQIKAGATIILSAFDENGVSIPNVSKEVITSQDIIVWIENNQVVVK